VDAFLNNSSNNAKSNTNNSVYGFNYVKTVTKNPSEKKLEREFKKRTSVSGLPDDYPNLMPHQKALLRHIRTIVRRSMHEHTHEHDLRGMLVNHTTGAGKTAMILGGILEYLKTGRRIFVVTTVSNRKSNSAQVYAENLLKFFPTAIPPLINSDLTANNYNSMKAHIAMVADSLKDIFKQLGVEFHTFETIASRFDAVPRSTAASNKRGPKAFVEDLEKYGGVFFFDEAHELVQQSGTRDREAIALKSMQRILEIYTKKQMGNGRAVLHAYLFSATPGDTLAEWEKMLSFVRPTRTPSSFIKLKRQTYVNAISKAKQYLMIDRADISKNIALVGKVNDREVPFDANLVHIAIIVTNIEKMVPTNERPEPPQRNHLRPSEPVFMKKMKQMQNYVTETDISVGFAIPASKKSIIPAVAYQAGLKPINIRTRGKSKYKTVYYSEKLEKVVQHVLAAPGKQLIYAEDRVTLQILQKLVHDKGVANIGFDVPISELKKSLVSASPRERMAFCTKASDVAKAMSLSNVPENVHGTLLKIIAVMGDGFQGLDIKGLRGVHIVDAKNNEKHHRQLIGRVGRARGLNHLIGNHRFSERFEYITRFPGDAESPRFWTQLSSVILNTFVSSGIKMSFTKLGAGYTKPKKGYGALENLYRINQHLTQNNRLVQPTPTINRIIRKHRNTNNVRNVKALIEAVEKK